jgi:hypothetical protein
VGFRFAGEHLETSRQELNGFLDGTPEADSLIGRGLVLIEIVRRELLDGDGFVSAHDRLNANYVFDTTGWPSRNDLR